MVITLARATVAYRRPRDDQRGMEYRNHASMYLLILERLSNLGSVLVLPELDRFVKPVVHHQIDLAILLCGPFPRLMDIVEAMACGIPCIGFNVGGILND